MSDADLIQLACTLCGWRPTAEKTMGLVQAHFETEHPEHEGGPSLTMVVVCPACDNVCPQTYNDGKRFVHDCPSCKRTYRIPHGRMEGP